MTGRDAVAMLPLLVPAYAGVILMLVTAFLRSTMLAQMLAHWFCIVSLSAAFASLFVAAVDSPRVVAGILDIDSYSMIFFGVIIVAGLLVTLLSGQYLQAHEKNSQAFYILLLFAVTGMLVIVSSAHFVSFFLGLETLSVSLYGLIGYTRGQPRSLEAAIKYLIMAAVSSAILLFGIALIYADAGSMQFAKLIALLPRLGITSLFGFGLVLVGFGFKLAWAPFHTWSPDVYQGAPAPVSALIATGSKGAVFALVLKLILSGGLQNERVVFTVLAVLAVSTMFVGNLLALTQRNLKRLLAYSSVAQMGYLFVPLLSAGRRGASSAVFYLVAYMAAALAAFGVIAVVSAHRSTGDIEEIADYAGLASRRPVLAGVMAICMLSLIGMPLTAGFFAKFYIFSAAAQAGLWWLLIVAVVNTGISAFYYLRVVFALYSDPVVQGAEYRPTRLIGPSVVLALCSVVLIVVGVYPSALVRLSEVAARMLRF